MRRFIPRHAPIVARPNGYSRTMNRGIRYLVALIAHIVIWRAVSTWMRGQPPAVQTIAFLAAGALVIGGLRWSHKR